MRCSFITGPHRHRKWEGRVEGNKNYKLKWIKIGFIIGVFRRFTLGLLCLGVLPSPWMVQFCGTQSIKRFDSGNNWA
ncbi:Os01g0567700 [Oryza sativa Japonica Group]|uniref:Os01g0567700 protein n=1 Tax=Oryza sativa subsp. japonica TaxID=39947 RepID=A0A0P0V478_ORYSJ|nr:Os01g0567700 [Oryza sativa Japonica Group]